MIIEREVGRWCVRVDEPIAEVLRKLDANQPGLRAGGGRGGRARRRADGRRRAAVADEADRRGPGAAGRAHRQQILRRGAGVGAAGGHPAAVFGPGEVHSAAGCPPPPDRRGAAPRPAGGDADRGAADQRGQPGVRDRGGGDQPQRQRGDGAAADPGHEGRRGGRGEVPDAEHGAAVPEHAGRRGDRRGSGGAIHAEPAGEVRAAGGGHAGAVRLRAGAGADGALHAVGGGEPGGARALRHGGLQGGLGRSDQPPVHRADGEDLQADDPLHGHVHGGRDFGNGQGAAPVRQLLCAAALQFDLSGAVQGHQPGVSVAVEGDRRLPGGLFGPRARHPRGGVGRLPGRADRREAHHAGPEPGRAPTTRPACCRRNSRRWSKASGRWRSRWAPATRGRCRRAN
jgi:hypothetical protein